MISTKIIGRASFLKMPVSSQCLYFHLGMRADDDGFVASPKRITAMVGCSGADLEALLAAGLLLRFPSGICLIRHWKVNNLIKKDRYRETQYTDEAEQIDCYVMKIVITTDENGEELEEFVPVEDQALEAKLMEIATMKLNDDEEADDED
jgi:hypothetical protein